MGPGAYPLEKMLTSYIAAAAFWEILKHNLKETIIYFAEFAKMKKIFLFKVMQTRHTKIRPKIKMKTMSLKHAL